MWSGSPLLNLGPSTRQLSCAERLTLSEPERAIEQFVRDASGKELKAIRRCLRTESDRRPRG